jgi:protein involved in polysaccharide export with SLBB domain
MIPRRLVVRLVLALGLAAAMFGPAAAQQDERIYVLGVVKSPGSYTYTADMTVGDAIDRAGGYARQSSGIEINRMVNGEKQILAATPGDAVLPNDAVLVKP